MGPWLPDSVVVTPPIAALQVAPSTLAGYALARCRFRGAGVIFRVVVGAQMFPFSPFIIPTFLILRFVPLRGGNALTGQGGAGLLGTYAAPILPFTVT
jgi:multiple sugar transport system permease protein